ncbi:hypothetical protein ACGF3J_30715 [Streptomyces sp. NPDC048171]|uniref:hypothetical protein n=1 Tax=unclassified Streptomyces TaxID=2593676 RepID=UPI00137173D7|nr:hypothetical protein [Streptomyces sp. SID5789]MZE74192.1 hypothetical protein [Streptomyces sp. SID5789]
MCAPTQSTEGRRTAAEDGASVAHGIAPVEVPDADDLEFFLAAGLEILASGELPLTTTDRTLDGSRTELPTRWLDMGRAG